MLGAGKRNRWISVQEQTEGQAPSGQPVDEWPSVLDCWAAINASTTKTQQRFSAAGISAQLTHVVTIRFPANVELHSNMRVVHRGRVFEIMYLQDADEGRVELDLYCRELNEGTP